MTTDLTTSQDRVREALTEAQARVVLSKHVRLPIGDLNFYLGGELDAIVAAMCEVASATVSDAALAWLARRDNLILENSHTGEWVVRRATSYTVRGRGSTPLAALEQAMLAAAADEREEGR